MSHRTETAEFTVLCLIHDKDRILMQDRKSEDWKGYTLPGGHVEIGESIVDAVIREMKEETGLIIRNPKLCGVKQFPIYDGDYSKGRYVVFLFETDEYSGELVSSEEGTMHWVSNSDLDKVDMVDDLPELLEVMMDGKYSEFQYIVKDKVWNIIRK